MGIKPEGTNPVIVPPDNTQTRWGEWEVSLDTAGQQAGEVFAETHAIATSANSVAASALAEAQAAIGRAEQGIADVGELNDQLMESVDPDDPSAQQWVWIGEINRLQAEIDEAQNRAIKSNTNLLRKLTEEQWHLIKIAPRVGYSGDLISVEFLGETSRLVIIDGSNVRLYFHHYRYTAIGSWTGYLRSTDGTILFNFTPTARSYEEAREVGRSSSEGSAFYREYKVIGLDSSFDTKTNDSFTVPERGNWISIPNMAFTATSRSIHYYAVRGRWKNATYVASYGIRVMVNGVEKGRVFGENIGPLIHHGPRSQSMNGEFSLFPGDVVTVQAWADHSNSLNRLLTNSHMELGWVLGSDESEAAAA